MSLTMIVWHTGCLNDHVAAPLCKVPQVMPP